MKSIRIGNDIDILWGIFTGDGLDEQPYDMTGKDISLYAQTRASDIFEVVEFEIDKHIIKWRFKGKEQRTIGTYMLTLVENKGKDDMHTVDICKAFALVAESCQATCDCGDSSNVSITTLELKSKMSVGYPSSGGDSTNITIDDALSTESENPVQNKVVTAAINGVSGKVETLTETVETYETKVTEAHEMATSASEQSYELAEQVATLSSKVDDLENDEIIWNDVEVPTE